jgi:hypothetical protein
MTVSSEAIRQSLLDLVHQRGPDKTICPSEVARALGDDQWRDLMPTVRLVGTQLVAEGVMVALQRGQVVDSETAQGPIRYGLRSPERQV